MAKKEEILDAAKKVATKAAQAAKEVAEVAVEKAAEVAKEAVKEAAKVAEAPKAEAKKAEPAKVITPKMRRSGRTTRIIRSSLTLPTNVNSMLS